MTEKPDEPKTAEKPTETAPEKRAKKPAAKKLKKRKRRSKKARGGRPKWSPSIDERIAVEQMKFCGESEATIARSLKVDVDTLRRNCPVELADGYANRRRQVTKMLFDAAQDGNVTAIKRLDEMGRISGAAAALKDRESGGGGPAPVAAIEPKPEKAGKKQERLAAAQLVASSGKFQPPAAPKLVVNNAVNE